MKVKGAGRLIGSFPKVDTASVSDQRHCDINETAFQRTIISNYESVASAKEGRQANDLQHNLRINGVKPQVTQA